MRLAAARRPPRKSPSTPGATPLNGLSKGGAEREAHKVLPSSGTGFLELGLPSLSPLRLNRLMRARPAPALLVKFIGTQANVFVKLAEDLSERFGL